MEHHRSFSPKILSAVLVIMGQKKLDFILQSPLFPLTCHIKKITAMLAIKSWTSSVWKQRAYIAKVVGLVSRETSFF